MSDNTLVYEAIARNLRAFGYADVTAAMVRETDEQPGQNPHGIVSMFAEKQLAGARESGLLALKESA